MLCILPVIGHAEEILVLRSAPLNPYDEAIAGFNQCISALPAIPGIKSISAYNVSQLDISGSAAVVDLGAKIAALQPNLVLAVGSKALAAVADIPLPIVYLMVASPEEIRHGKDNITGVKLIVDPEKQLAAIATHLPFVKAVGIIHGPEKNNEQTNVLEWLAKKRPSPSLVTKEVSRAQDVGEALRQISPDIDALLLLPDTSVLTATTLDIFSLYSLNNKKPLIAFAPQYLKRGASLVIFSTPNDMGKQAGHMVQRLLTGKTVVETPPEASHTVTVISNAPVLKKLGFGVMSNERESSKLK